MATVKEKDDLLRKIERCCDEINIAEETMKEIHKDPLFTYHYFDEQMLSTLEGIRSNLKGRYNTYNKKFKKHKDL